MEPRARFPSGFLGTCHPLISLSTGQILAVGVSSIGGILVWILAARQFPPAEVGRASHLIALGGLVSTIVAAGLGQYLLAALPAARLRGTLLIRVIAAGIGASVLVPITLGLLLYGGSEVPSILLLATIAVTVTITTLQDALYVFAQSTRDIAAKAGLITLARLASLALLVPLIRDAVTTYWGLVLLLTIPQMTVSILWLAWRSSPLLSMTRRTSPSKPTSSMLAVGYAFALTAAAVTWGLPAVVTSELEPERAAIFYTSWVLGSIVGTVPASLANALVASNPAISFRHVTVVMSTQLLVSGGLLISLLAGAPWLSGMFGANYEAMPSILPAVAAGQLAVGVSVVVIAFLRVAGRPIEAITASAALALLGSIVPAIVATRLGESQFLISFASGTVAAALLGGAILVRRLSAARSSQVG